MRHWHRGLLLLPSVLLLAGMAACSPAGGTSPEASSPAGAPEQPLSQLPRAASLGEVRSSSGGGVDIEIRWSQAGEGALVFEVAMNTHSVDLDRYDLSGLVVLRDDTGTAYTPTGWDSPPGGHHRSGYLTFPIPDSLLRGEAHHFELMVTGVADVKERVFRWDL